MDDKTLDFVKRLAKAMAAQFGGNCEVVVHDLNTGDPERTIAAIENKSEPSGLRKTSE